MPFFFRPCLRIRRKCKRKSKKRDERVITIRDVTSPVTADSMHSSRSNSNSSIVSEISELTQSVFQPGEITEITSTSDVALSRAESRNEEYLNTQSDIPSTVHFEVNSQKDTRKDSQSAHLGEKELTYCTNSENIYQNSEDSKSASITEGVTDIQEAVETEKKESIAIVDIDDELSDSEETNIYIQKSYEILSKITVNSNVFEKIEELKALELAAKKAKERKKKKLEEAKSVSIKNVPSETNDFGDSLQKAKNESKNLAEDRNEIANMNETLTALSEDDGDPIADNKAQINLETEHNEESIKNKLAENVEIKETKKSDSDFQDKIAISNSFVYEKEKYHDQRSGDGAHNLEMFEKQKLKSASQTDFEVNEPKEKMISDDVFTKPMSPSTYKLSNFLDAPLNMDCTKVESAKDELSQTSIANAKSSESLRTSSSSNLNKDNREIDVTDKINKKHNTSSQYLNLPEADKDCTQINKIKNIENAHIPVEGDDLNSITESRNNVNTSCRCEGRMENYYGSSFATFQSEKEARCELNDVVNDVSNDYLRSGDSVNVMDPKKELPLISEDSRFLKYKIDSKLDEKSKEKENEPKPFETESLKIKSIENKVTDIYSRISIENRTSTSNVDSDITEYANINKEVVKTELPDKSTYFLNFNKDSDDELKRIKHDDYGVEADIEKPNDYPNPNGNYEKLRCACEKELHTDDIHRSANVLQHRKKDFFPLQADAGKFASQHISTTSESESCYSDESEYSEKSDLGEDDIEDAENSFPLESDEGFENVLSNHSFKCNRNHQNLIRCNENFRRQAKLPINSEGNCSCQNYVNVRKSKFDNTNTDNISLKKIAKDNEIETEFIEEKKYSNGLRNFNVNELLYETSANTLLEKNSYKNLLPGNLQKSNKNGFEIHREYKSVSKYSLSPVSDSSTASKIYEGGNAKDLNLNAKPSESFLISGWGDNKAPVEMPLQSGNRKLENRFPNRNRDTQQLLVIGKNEIQKMPNRRKIKISITKKGTPKRKDNITITTNASDDRYFCHSDANSSWQSGDHIELPTSEHTDLDDHELNDVFRSRGSVYSPKDDLSTNLDTAFRLNAINEIEMKRRESINLFNKKKLAAESEMGSNLRRIPITKSDSFSLLCGNVKKASTDNDMKYFYGELNEIERNSTDFLKLPEFQKNKITGMNDKTSFHTENRNLEGDSYATPTELSPPTSEKMTPDRRRILEASRCIRSAKYPLRINTKVTQKTNLYPINPVIIKSSKVNVVYLTKDDENVYKLKKGYKLYPNARKFKYVTSDDHVPEDIEKHHKQNSFSCRSTSPYEMKTKFDDLFRKYAGKGRANGELISYKRSTEWLRDAGVIGKVLTAEEANDVFKCVAGVKVALNKGDYRHFLYKLSRAKRLNYNEMYERLCDANKCVHG